MRAFVAFHNYGRAVVDDYLFQNFDLNHAHDRSASDGSTTAVVGIVLDNSDLDLGAPDYRVVQTFRDEYASHLS